MELQLSVEKAAQIAHAAAFANGGQCCCAGTRTYVQSGIYDNFVEKAAEIAEKRSVGNPFDDVQQGPQVIRPRMNTLRMNFRVNYGYFPVRWLNKSIGVLRRRLISSSGYKQ